MREILRLASFFDSTAFYMHRTPPLSTLDAETPFMSFFDHVLVSRVRAAAAGGTIVREAADIARIQTWLLKARVWGRTHAARAACAGVSLLRGSEPLPCV